MTDHVNSEENPSVSEKKFSYIFQMTPDPIAISEMNTGEIIDINQAYIDWTGYSREEVIGKSALELRIWIHPEDRRKIFDALKKNGDINGTEVMMRLKSGQIRNVVFSARFLEMGQERYLLSLIHDISERKQMELALRESERRFRAISDYTPDWENWVGPDGKLYNTPQKLDRAIRWVIVCHNREGERIWQSKCGRVTMQPLKPKLPWKQ